MKLKHVFRLFLVLVFTCALSVNCKENSKTENVDSTNNDESNTEIATSTKQLNKIMNDPKAKIIRNHSQLLAYIKNDEFLNKSIANDLLIEFMSNVKFNKKGLMTYNYEMVKLLNPNIYKEINNRLGMGFGFDFDAVSEDYDNYKCVKPATCTSSTNDICIGDNCTSSIDFSNPFKIIDILDLQKRYINNFIDEEFSYYQNEYSLFPKRSSTEWFFENFDLTKYFENDIEREWFSKNIKSQNIIVYGNTVKSNNEKIKLASLVFTKGLTIPDGIKTDFGLIIDSNMESTCVSCWFGMKPPCLCWLIYCCGGATSNCATCTDDMPGPNLKDLIKPEAWFPELDILSQMPLNSVLPETSVLNIEN